MSRWLPGLFLLCMTAPAGASQAHPEQSTWGDTVGSAVYDTTQSALPDTTYACRTDSMALEAQNSDNLFQRLLRPIGLTLLAGGALLALFLARGH